YWYDTTHVDSGDSSRTNAGGSWGLDSEQSAGDTVPTLDSLNRFMSAADLQALWQNPGSNQYHANYETGHGGYKFGTLFVLNQTLHALYGYDNNSVTVDNLGGGTQSGVSVQSRVIDLSGKVLDDQTATAISLSSQQVRTGVLTPKVPAATTPPAAAKTYFVELLVKQGGTVADRNVYWLSTQADVVNWGKT